MRICVITGASSGMGREFLRRLDAEETFDEIWVIARRESILSDLQKETRAVIRPIAADLTLLGNIHAYAELLDSVKPQVDVLVNASGYGYFGYVENGDADEQLGMIDLNCRALAAITYYTLPYMQSGARIFQIGSLSAFQPVPCIALYGASKSFVLSFSRALNVELRHRGIRVMAVCPGWVKTDFFKRAMKDSTIHYFNRFYTPEQVVQRALKDMKKGRDVSIAGFPVRLQVFLTKLLPHRIVMKIWCRQQDIC